jgi:aspartyl-tRNA synthetase
MTKTNMRTQTCGELTVAYTGDTVSLCGWIHRKRDHGGLLFIDLRDNYGLTQIVMQKTAACFSVVEHLRQESVIRVIGKVVTRTENTQNPNLATGQIEVIASEITVLSEASELPVPVFGDVQYPEDQRLKHRYLDLRRDELHSNILLRSKIISYLRRFMEGEGFTEFQTPILTASSPEGARDFLIPSRLHPGKFYALPQAPQQFKQLLMVSGFDRYFQIAPCFRDEAARADRSPGEFYQLDIEMSFVNQEDVFSQAERILHSTFTEFSNGKTVSSYPFQRITYKDSMEKYGNDKPDLRNPIVMSDASLYFVNGGFGLFEKMASDGKSSIWAIPVKGNGNINRKFCDKMNSWAIEEGQKGMGYIYWNEEGAQGPIAKNLHADKLGQLEAAYELGNGDAIFFVAGIKKDFLKFCGFARTKIAEELGLIKDDHFHFCWVVDFPMFELSNEGKIDFAHNPFSMPQGEMEALETKNPLDILAYQYDIVCNGIELSSGAIRNHRPDIMLKAFEIAGYKAEEVEERFGGMLNAFRYGAPPHGGLAPGVDRMVMMLANKSSIRDIIAFPLNQQGQDLMMNAPSEVTDKQLKELNIRTYKPLS